MENLGVSVSEERVNQEITRFLRAYCADNKEDWAPVLPLQNLHTTPHIPPTNIHRLPMQITSYIIKCRMSFIFE